MIISYFRLKVGGCLRHAGVLCICGAPFAWVVAGEVFRNGHGQNIWWLLCHQSQPARVLPIIWHPIDDEAEATLGGLAAFTEQPKLEVLLIICKGIYNVSHLQLHKFPTEESIFGIRYRFLWASSVQVLWRQRKAICFSSDYQWSG